jgi:hypothetical protein
MINETETLPDTVTFTHWEICQVVATHGALAMADEHKMYLAHPKAIRGTAVELLAKVGVTASPKAKWKTLRKLFDATFAQFLKD